MRTIIHRRGALFLLYGYYAAMCRYNIRCLNVDSRQSYMDVSRSCITNPSVLKRPLLYYHKYSFL